MLELLILNDAPAFVGVFLCGEGKREGGALVGQLKTAPLVVEDELQLREDVHPDQQLVFCAFQNTEMNFYPSFVATPAT